MIPKEKQIEQLFKTIFGEMMSLEYPDISENEVIMIVEKTIVSFKKIYYVK